MKIRGAYSKLWAYLYLVIFIKLLGLTKWLTNWLIKLQILLEIFFSEHNLIRFEIFKAIWDIPSKNNNHENNNYASFLAKFFPVVTGRKFNVLDVFWTSYVRSIYVLSTGFRSLFFGKMEWTRWLQLGSGVSNTISNKSHIFKKHIYFRIDIPEMPEMVNL